MICCDNYIYDFCSLFCDPFLCHCLYFKWNGILITATARRTSTLQLNLYFNISFFGDTDMIWFTFNRIHKSFFDGKLYSHENMAFRLFRSMISWGFTYENDFWVLSRKKEKFRSNWSKNGKNRRWNLSFRNPFEEILGNSLRNRPLPSLHP